MSETVDQRACQRCGAQSPLDADFCWQCYTPFRGGRATFGSEERTTPLARAVSGRTATMAPREPVVQTGSAGLPPVLGTIIRLVIVVGLLAGGWFAWQRFFGGYPFPDSIRGEQRIEGEAGDDLDGFVSAAADLFDLDAEAAMYGELESPAYIMYTYGIPDGQSVDDWLSRMETLPGSEDVPFLTEAAKTGFGCQPQPQGATCAWMDGEDLLVGIGGIGLTEEQVRPIAEEVRTKSG